MAIIKRYQTPILGNYKIAILKYGFLCSLFICFVVIIQYALDIPISQPITFVEDIALLVCMFVSTYYYRKKLPNKQLFLKEAYLLCLGIGIVSAIVYAVFIMIYAQSIDPALSERYYQLQESALLNANEVVNEMELRIITSPKNMGIMSFIFLSVLSILFALIVGLFMRTQKNILRPSNKKK